MFFKKNWEKISEQNEKKNNEREKIEDEKNAEKKLDEVINEQSKNGDIRLHRKIYLDDIFSNVDEKFIQKTIYKKCDELHNMGWNVTTCTFKN